MLARGRCARPPVPPRAYENPLPTLDTVIPLSRPIVGRLGVSASVASGRWEGGNGDKRETLAVSGGRPGRDEALEVARTRLGVTSGDVRAIGEDGATDRGLGGTRNGVAGGARV